LVVKDQQYVQSHQELDAYLNAHPDVRSDLMANPQDFCHGAQEAYMNGSTGVTGGAGVSGRGTAGASGAAGTSTGTSMNPATTTTHGTKPNQ
jgi:hypothetical protein